MRRYDKPILITDMIINAKSNNISHSVKISLRRLGLSELGINQLSRGQIISDPKDRKIVSQIVAKALGV